MCLTTQPCAAIRYSLSVKHGFVNLVSQDGRVQKLEKAKITLNDCLACSGCITSAESVLITQQSHEELYRVLRNNKVKRVYKSVCVSVLG